MDVIHQKGFTIAEAIIVVTLLMLLGLLAVPAVTNSLALNDLASATDDFVNQVEFARYQAGSRNRAYALVVEAGTSGNLGRIRIHEGIGSVCAPATFQQDGSDPDPVLDVRDIQFTTAHENVLLESIEPASLSGTGLCFKPDGRVLRIDTGVPVLPAPTGYAAGEAVYGLRLLGTGDAATLHQRRVVVPYNGIPKVE